MRRYVIVGAGVRARAMFALPLVNDFKETALLAGICDPNPVRAHYLSEECGGIPVYEDFDRMLAEAKPNIVIVTTPDNIHHEYIIRALEAGCDAISEKPMTTDAEKCKAILEAEKRTGRRVFVTFNCRYMPYVVQIKQLLDEGVIGRILNVDLQWSLDTIHGGEYFRRWHSNMETSGGLLVCKSTHHFDMVNWWLGDEPERVHAFGGTYFFGPSRDERGERCMNCSHTRSCEFYYDLLSDEFRRAYYHNGEANDGYMRDKCVFSDDVNIYDTMTVNVKYKQGTLLNYSLNAYSPYEGWRAVFMGTKGRMEVEEVKRGLSEAEPYTTIKLFRHQGEMITYQNKKAGGSHGGGDERLRKMLFEADMPDPLNQQAGSWAGAMSMIIGAAANLSIAENRPIGINELLN
ncbi:MAG: oxidoreductase domain protein [Paenibacillus sp.]|nr:oxidoreductase domain protein [Paenibacillus sp.]